MYLPKTPRVLRGAPRGCTHRRHRALKGTPKVKGNDKRDSNSKATAIDYLVYTHGYGFCFCS